MSKDQQILKDRLKEIRIKLNLKQQEFADRLNIPHSAISKYERGEVKPSSDLLAKIGELYNVNLNWLLTAKGEMFSGSKEQSVDTTEIPERGEVEASAGEGCFIYNEEITGYVAFENKFLKQLGASIPECDILTVKGDSMLPTLVSSDKILVDKSKKDVLNGNIYILRVENTLYVKRLQKLPKGRLKVISDNKDYESFDLIPSEDDFEVCGRILWSGRTYV